MNVDRLLNLIISWKQQQVRVYIVLFFNCNYNMCISYKYVCVCIGIYGNEGFFYLIFNVSKLCKSFIERCKVL